MFTKRKEELAEARLKKAQQVADASADEKSSQMKHDESQSSASNFEDSEKNITYSVKNIDDMEIIDVIANKDSVDITESVKIKDEKEVVSTTDQQNSKDLSSIKEPQNVEILVDDQHKPNDDAIVELQSEPLSKDSLTTPDLPINALQQRRKTQSSVTFSAQIHQITIIEEANKNTRKHCNCFQWFFAARYFVVGFSLLGPFIVTYQKNIDKTLNSSIKKSGNLDDFRMGFIKAAYQIGHALFQVPTSRVSEIYGPRYVIIAGAILMGCTSIIAPFVLSMHYLFMFADLILLGMFAGVMTPALIALFSNWLPTNEKSIFVSLYLVSSRMGAGLSALATDIVKEQLKGEWQTSFIFGGSLSIGFGFLCLFFLTNSPVKHKLVSKRELFFISQTNALVREKIEIRQRKRFEIELQKTDAGQTEKISGDIDQQSTSKSKACQKAPWSMILRSKTVWAFFVAKMATKIVGEAMGNNLPDYLEKIVGIRSFNKSMFINYGCFCLGALFFGFVSQLCLKYSLASKKTVRKSCQAIGSFGVALLLVMMALNNNDVSLTKYSAAIMFFITTAGTSGETQIPFDISTKYPSTIHSMGSTMGSIVSILQPILTGWFLDLNEDNLEDAWCKFLIALALISSFGGLVFVLFADPKIKSFDSCNLDGSFEHLDSNTTIVDVPIASQDNKEKDDNISNAAEDSTEESCESKADTTSNAEITPRGDEHVAIELVGKEAGPI